MLKLCSLFILATSLLLGCVALNLLEEEPVYTCEGMEYTPPYQICENGVLKIKCGDDYYSPIEQFCSEQDNRIYVKCGGRNYDTENQICKNARVYNKCGDSIINANIEGCCNNIIFNLATQFCFHVKIDSIYDKCDGELYNPIYQICESGIMKMICGNEEILYDPATQFCSGDAVYDKCDGVEYNPPDQKCEDDIVFLKCEEKWYNPSLVYCDSNVMKDKETFIDERDGKIYKYVIIGDQTWMAENLQYETLNTKCYGDNPDNCEIFGIYYDWNTANTACPFGWHLPSDDEWNTLISTAGAGGNAAIKLKANSNMWLYGKGTDDFGFTALPGGYYRYGGYSFMQIWEVAGFWSASTGSVYGSAHFRYLHEYRTGLDGFYINDSWVNVRCVKD
jgi:uncharacterized protein (TIGR02145 family)